MFSFERVYENKKTKKVLVVYEKDNKLKTKKFKNMEEYKKWKLKRAEKALKKL